MLQLIAVVSSLENAIKKNTKKTTTTDGLKVIDRGFMSLASVFLSVSGLFIYLIRVRKTFSDKIPGHSQDKISFSRTLVYQESSLHGSES